VLDGLSLTIPILKVRAKAPGTTLSGGEQQMLAITRVMRTGARRNGSEPLPARDTETSIGLSSAKPGMGTK
jgi:predicted ABC-type transport system involved in lysophospholipase L1 biosynthesis ATPase subunit